MAQGIKAEIDPLKVETLARLGATNEEIGDFFCVSGRTIRNRFSKIVLKGRAERKAKLRKLMWDSAERGNVSMQIWLSKNELGMSDKVETSSTEDQTITVTLE